MDVYIQCMGMSGQKRSVRGRVHTVYGMSGQKRSVSGRVWDEWAEEVSQWTCTYSVWG